jgi:23S rRNA pseudouridine1911/1915/1917 synthase
MQTVHIDETNQGNRADAFVSNNFKVHSRSFLKHNWERLISINGQSGKPSYKLRKGDVLEILDQEVDKLLEEHSFGEIIPQHHSLDIVYEDKDFLIINKPKNLVVHPGVGNPRDTLVNYVVEYLQSKNEYDTRMERGGIVHRLDKPVSGLILFAKNAEAQLYFQKQFEEHNVEKIYLAEVEYGNDINSELKAMIPHEPLDVSKELDTLVKNNFETDSSWLKIEGYVGRSSINRMKMVFKAYSFNHGRAALSYIKPISENEFLVIIKTGRMHQIRATIEYLGANIIGDTLYKTLKGGAAPDEIGLESILICCNDMQGKRLINRLR